jgi:hypothetical protein
MQKEAEKEKAPSSKSGFEFILAATQHVSAGVDKMILARFFRT